MGKILYTFVDSLGNDESQRFYATKAKYYIAEGQRLFKDRQQPHLQSFYSKSAEIFPRLCVNMQRLLDAMLVLFEMRKNEDLQFTQVVDQTFVTKAKFYIEKHLIFNKHANGDIVSYVSLETCHITANLFDNYLFKSTLNLFNLEHSVNQPSMPSTQFRTLVAEKPSIEKRILQLPYQFFLRSDLKQPTTNENGKRINAPFHHVDNNLLNNIMNKLVDQKLLSIGYYISRPRAQQTQSFIKNPIPIEPSEKEQFLQHLEEYKINADEYQNLLSRSNLPNNCTLLPEAKQLLTTRVEHRDDCTKYGLISIVNVNNEHASDGTIALNFGNIANTTDRSLFVEMPAVVTTNNKSHETDQLVDINNTDNVLLNKNDEVVTQLLENDLDMAQVEQNQATEFIEINDKTPDAQPKDCDHNREGVDCQPIQSINQIESETAGTTPSNNHPPDVKACVRAILQYPSIILSSSDIALATRHYSAVARQRSIQLMINKKLLHEDYYFVRKLSKSVKVMKGFAKRVPQVNDEQSRFDFITALNDFGITWELFKSFFDLTKDGFHTTTQLLLNQTAEVLLDSEDYRSYVNYDKRAIFRPIENATIEQDELEYGDNVTDAFYFGGECVYSQRIFLSFSTALVTMKASFHGFVKYFNSIFINKTTFPEKKLDEKNFQINWIIYCVLKLLLQWSSEEVIEIPYSLYDKDQANAFFSRHKSQLYSAFVKYWSNKAMHKTSNCTTSCTDILIVDGHQKTARTTCKFNNCYDNTIEELGPVLVGCPKSVSKHSGAYTSTIAFMNTIYSQSFLEINSNGLCEKHLEIVANRGIHVMEFDASDDVTDETCNVKRNELSDDQTRSTTYGFLVSFYSCGIVAGFDESIRSESPRRVLRHLIRIEFISFGRLTQLISI
ncbi:unnamed protein product [Rotaria sordida]|uniref:Uncharacterized protein n=1 Tax=Rotaria sordida TaxID=392033 RepID=A0A819P0U7_9BILA|nr:unnamed protein product [Rotaria sordida]